MAARTPPYFMHAFEGVIVRDEHRSGRHYDQPRKSDQFGRGFSWQSGDPKGNGRSIPKLAESCASRADAKRNTQDAEQRTEKINEVDVVQAHVVAFRTETAVTLNSGSFEVGS